MRWHIDGHVIQSEGEVGAMVQIKSAHKVLVGLAFTAVLGGYQARDKLQQFGGARNRAQFQLGVKNNTFGCGDGRAGQVEVAAKYQYLCWRVATSICGQAAVTENESNGGCQC